MPLLRRASGFLFAPISATGFGLMRMLWAGVAFVYWSFQWKDVPLFYGENGILPKSIEQFMVRGDYRFTVLSWFTDDTAVFGVYLLLLLALLCTCVGLWPRISTIVATLLLFSFHERNPFVLGGGDTVLRHVGFLLCIAPELRAFSLTRLSAQWTHFREQRSLLPPLTMPIWAMRMLLWQLIVLYGTSLWYKLLGSMWIRGTAVAAALHHPMFSRLPKTWADSFAPLMSTIDIAVMLFHFGWLFLLVPRAVTNLLPRWVPRLPLKRTLLMGGVLLHGGIFLMMDAGSFSLALMAAYAGCLVTEDFESIRAMLNRGFLRRAKRAERKTKLNRIAVLYDGKCGLCLRSIFMLELLDRLDRLQLVNFWNRIERNDAAPDIKEAELDRAMHVRFPSGKTLTGFDGVRAIAWHLPPLWPIAPFLYIPGIAPIGRRVYAWVAQRRKQCSHDGCSIR
jgi:predicted DCC family thiol-disulfide oxidoreductase YuxK